MTAHTPGRRKLTAREAAERFGVCPRTIRRIVAEPRDEFEARAASRRKQAAELVCKPCKLAFPIRDDIPVMLADEGIGTTQLRDFPG